MTLLLNKQGKMTCYSIEQRTRKCFKGYRFFSCRRNLSIKCEKIFLDATTKTELYTLKTATKKVALKAAEAARRIYRKKNC